MKKLLGIRISILLAILLCGFLPAVSFGELITIGLTGKVYSVSDPCNVFGGQIHINDTLTGTYTYDTSTPDSEPLDSTIGAYWHYSTPCGVSVNINDFNFRTDPNNVRFSVGIGNNYPGFGDIYSFGSDKNLSLSNGALVDSIVWQLTTDRHGPFERCPARHDGTNLNNWNMDYGLHITGPGHWGFAISADITSVVLIPEPATVLLLVFGIAICKRR